MMGEAAFEIQTWACFKTNEKEREHFRHAFKFVSTSYYVMSLGKSMTATPKPNR